MAGEGNNGGSGGFGNIGMGIGGVASAAQGIAGIFGPSHKKRTKRQEESNKRQMEYQYTLNEKSAEEAYRRQMEFFNIENAYNTPEQQRRRAEQANLGVGLLYGSGAGVSGQGSLGGAPQGGGSGGGNVDQAAISQAMTAERQFALDSVLATAQAQNIKADTKKKEAEAENIGAGTEKIGNEIESIVEDIENKKVQRLGMIIDNRINDINAEILENTKGEQEATIRYNTEKAWAEMWDMKHQMEISHTEAHVTKETAQERIGQVAAELMLTTVKVEAQRKGIELTEADIEVAKAEAQNIMTNTIVTQWAAKNYKDLRIWDTADAILGKAIGGVATGAAIKGAARQRR